VFFLKARVLGFTSDKRFTSSFLPNYPFANVTHPLRNFYSADEVPLTPASERLPSQRVAHEFIQLTPAAWSVSLLR
jgi:hypothetical protein